MIYLDDDAHLNPHIWAVRSNGTDLHKVANHAVSAVISPDGKRVYCFCAGGVGVMKPDGSHLHSIGGGSENWSLSGVGTFATNGEDPGIGGVAVLVGSDSTGVAKPIYTPSSDGWDSASIGYALISPDGHKVVFEEDKSTRLKAYPYTQTDQTNVYVINSDGTGLAMVATNNVIYGPTSVSCNGSSPFNGAIPFADGFSEDGSKMVLSNDPGLDSGRCSSAVSAPVGPTIVATASSSGAIQSVFDTPFGTEPSIEDSGPVLSADGSRMVFAAPTSAKGPTDGLYTIGADGTGQREILQQNVSRFVLYPTAWGKVLLP